MVFVIAAGYSLIVALSYFSHIGNDQSALLNGDFDPDMIKNAGGPLGAWLAHTLIYKWLGIGSFILIYYIAMCGISMLKVYRPPFWSLTLRCLLTAVALSVICGFATYKLSSPIYWGGQHGHLLNEKLMIFTGFWGALGLSLIMGGLVVILYLKELRHITDYISEGIRTYRARQAERRAERERIREAEEAERREREAQEEAIRAAEAARIAEEERIEAEKAEMQRLQDLKDSAAPLYPQAPQQPLYGVATPVPKQAVAKAVAKPTETESLFSKPDDETKETSASTPAPSQSDSAPEVPTVVGEFNETVVMDDDNTVDEAGQSDTENTVKTESSTLSPLFVNKNEDEEEDKEEYADMPLFATDKTVKAQREVADMAPFDPRADLSHYKFPSIEFLRPSSNSGVSVDAQEMEENKIRITDTLNHYGIPISKIEATVGPTVTLYEIIPAEGVRIAKIKRLEDDIALSLAALGIRIIAPIPGKGTIGIEVPNKDPQIVSMRSIIESPTFANSHMDLPMAMGRTISNEVFMADLCKMPHLLVAGATGMGKSVGLNAIIASLLYKKHPAELKFVLIDPKMVEFSLYARLERHYLAKLPEEEEAIITDPMKVVATLNSLCVEMDNRYALLKEASMRNIKEYNDKFIHRHLNPEKGHRFLPYIVVIVDEFADLIMTAGKEVETPIARIAQKARAVGIHMILATQRPSTNVITGVIKANFPGRIAFRVFQMVDSRTIIDRPGANQLIGRGDMLFSNNGKLDRVQCAFIDTPEVSAICDSINEQVGYPSAYELPEYVAEAGDAGKLASVGDRDPLFDECARLVVTTDTASTSSLQRRYSIGYNRAGKIMDQMEAAGIVGPSQGGKPRQVLVDPMTLERILENN
ncbi:DNA translocase FtsK 4TM domain-containing protein [uncultured Duncaniella sp.]|uniref:FtsK/SpoIIIE family DNA translocase n=1 Tax=uncultured Duncaniella sp. TaxID=2768039 RepID=UPI00339C3B14